MRELFKVIDLFSGAGGLSLGFIQSHKYDIKVAFENNPAMQKTYSENHPEVDVRGDVCSADYSEIQNEYGPIDVVIGGPPCQGFSNANRQKNRAINQNNMLVKQFIRAIIELQPKAFVMENVSMLRSDVHRFYLDESDIRLIGKYSISMTPTKLQLIEQKYMFDGALDIVKRMDDIKSFMWPEEHYAALNVIYKAAKNKQKMLEALEKHKKQLLRFSSDYICSSDDVYIRVKSSQAFSAICGYYSGNVKASELASAIEHAIMIQRMLIRAKEIIDNRLVVDEFKCDNGLYAIIQSYAVIDYMKAILESEPNSYTISASVLNAADFGAPQKRLRFVVMGIKSSIASKVMLPEGHFKESEYRTVRDAIGDLESIPPISELSEERGIPMETYENAGELCELLRDSSVLFNHIITNTTSTALERFAALKPGQNFHSLDESLKTNTYTDVSRTQNTIYLRLDYDRPSGTVVNVRKSMWIHPVLNRAISVREAARLQTFPDSFIFCGTKDKQYQQVGNAVPPIMAKAIALKLAAQLSGVEK